MALDPYAACPCGSGKKFKWCCQPIHVQIDRAFQMDGEGQHEAALRLMDEVIGANSANPEAYGRKAQLLYQNQRVEEAESTLQKALDINPDYPFGHFLRGVFRQNEGEFPGALLLLRKAATLYDPEAHDYLGQIYALVFECEMRLNHPVAAHAALKLALRYLPANEEARKAQDELFGDQSRLPAVARRDYTFQSPPADVPAARRQAWEQALASRTNLDGAVKAFEQVTKADEQDAAAWFNLGLARAWVGDNRSAVAALDRYVALEPDEQKAGDAWALVEVLNCGYEMEETSDYLESAVLYQIRGPEQWFAFLNEWQRDRRFVPVQFNEQQGLLTGIVLEKKPALTPELAATQMAGLGAYLMLVADHLRLWHTDAAKLAEVRQEVETRLGPALHLVNAEKRVGTFTDLMADAIAFPLNATDKEQAERRVNEHVERYFEDKWIHQPRKALSGVPPVDAVGSPALRKKLRGVIRFLQDCAVFSQAQGYDFDRLRRKLGLTEAGTGGGVGRPAPSAGTAPSAAGPDVGAMSAAELAAVTPDTLADDQLERAYQTAVKLDAKELAGRFARTLVARPPRPDGPRDRYPWYSHLTQLAQAEGNWDEALRLVDAGEKADADENAGRRHNDYELRRGQLHAKRGDADAAQAVFDRLIERAPGEVRYRGTAAEALLSAKQGAKALHFAEGGLARAREKNDRDSEQYFLELVEAAKRQMK